MRAAGTYGPSEPGPVPGRAQCLGGHTFSALANTTGKGKESMGPASRCSPPCAKGGQHGNAMQGGIDSTQLPGRYQVPGVGMVSQVPSIPQSAFADSSLCTREVRWPDGHISLGRFASNWPFLWHLVPVGPRREAGKRSGKNLVFPRKPAAASPTDLQVILPKAKITRRKWPRRGPALSPPGRNLGQPSPQGRLWL